MSSETAHTYKTLAKSNLLQFAKWKQLTQECFFQIQNELRIATGLSSKMNEVIL